MKKIIASENEAAKHIGIVNKEHLNKTGQALRIYKAALFKDKLEYRKRSGKDSLPSTCKK